MDYTAGHIRMCLDDATEGTPEGMEGGSSRLA
jgi:hypothetical protein